MSKKVTLLVFAVFAFAAVGRLSYKAEAQSGKAAAEKVKAEKSINPEECYQCHYVIKELRANGKHAKVSCVNCHSGLEKHLKAPEPDTRPGTNVSWEACGKCHNEQYDSFMKEAYHRPARDEKSQLTGRAPNPFWDKLMMGHAFTREHSAPRSHKWMLSEIDRIVEAKKDKVLPEIIRQAQDQHLKAHILWEYWTAENSDGFHNPEMARESLGRSVDESQKGIELLKNAPADKPVVR